MCGRESRQEDQLNSTHVAGRHWCRNLTDGYVSDRACDLTVTHPAGKKRGWNRVALEAPLVAVFWGQAERFGMPSEGVTPDGAEAGIDLTSGEWSDPKNGNRVVASEKDGFLCHVTLRARVDLQPHDVFRIFANPDNSHIFRDINSVPYRKVLEDDGLGRQLVEIEQASGFKFLVIPIKFSTRLFVEQDEKALSLKFRLAKKGTMKEFKGEWTLTPVTVKGEDGQETVTGTFVQLEQDVLPAFIPWFCGRILRGISVNAVRRLLEDLEKVVERLKKGESIDDVLQNRPKGSLKDSLDRNAGGKAGPVAADKPSGRVESFPVAGDCDDSD